ncbi:hypothetical protein GDO86_001611, partial [Hymenochirus boettgeri]
LISNLFCLSGLTSGDQVTQSPLEISINEGMGAALSCSYDVTAYNMFWYVQYPDKTPEMLLYNYGVKEQRGFTAKQEKSDFTFNLYKDQAELTDTGVYYCAVS